MLITNSELASSDKIPFKTEARKFLNGNDLAVNSEFFARKHFISPQVCTLAWSRLEEISALINLRIKRPKVPLYPANKAHIDLPRKAILRDQGGVYMQGCACA